MTHPHQLSPLIELRFNAEFSQDLIRNEAALPACPLRSFHSLNALEDHALSGLHADHKRRAPNCKEFIKKENRSVT